MYFQKLITTRCAARLQDKERQRNWHLLKNSQEEGPIADKDEIQSIVSKKSQFRSRRRSLKKNH